MQSLLDAMKSSSCNEPENDINSDLPVNIDSDLINWIQISASLTEIEVVLGDDFLEDRECETLVCKLCVPNPENRTIRKHSIPGLMTVCGVENTKLQIQSRELQNVKTHIFGHIKLTTHQSISTKH